MTRQAGLIFATALIFALVPVAGFAAPKPKPPAEAAPPSPPPAPPAVINGAELQGLDKISGRVTKFTASFGQKVKFGTLAISVTDCRKAPPEDPPESAAFLDVEETRPGTASPQQVFRGWMFASSPALNPLEHPVYDVWVLNCSSASGSSTRPD